MAHHCTLRRGSRTPLFSHIVVVFVQIAQITHVIDTVLVTFLAFVSVIFIQPYLSFGFEFVEDVNLFLV